MYLAYFEGSTQSWLQGAVRFPCLPGGPADAQDRWWTTLSRLIRDSEAVPQGMVALRVQLLEKDVLERVLIVSAPTERERELRRYLASFTRVDTIVPNSVELPLSRPSYDALIDRFPRWRCQVLMPPFTAGDLWFACDFRVAPFLDDLLSEAQTLGFKLGYQAHSHRLTMEPEWLREARKNALRISMHSGVPTAVADWQQRLVNRFSAARAVVEEFLAVETPAAAHWLQDALQRHFQRQYGPLGFETPEFPFIDRGYADRLATAMHTLVFDDIGLDVLCAGAMDVPARAELLGWRPAADLAARFTCPTIPDTAEPDAGTGPMPPPDEGGRDYLFVSYKRQDSHRIAPILEQIMRRGYKFWYDKGIPGGAEWDAVIEKKLENCQLVLLFISQAAVHSKFVRREVKFADALNKPVLSIKLEDADLEYGMGLLLTAYQIIDKSKPDFLEEFEKAMRHLMEVLGNTKK